MAVIKIHQAKTELSKLIKRVQAGEEVVIARGDTPVARLVPFETPKQEARRFGAWKDVVTYMAPDFDAPLDDFKEYTD